MVGRTMGRPVGGMVGGMVGRMVGAVGLLPVPRVPRDPDGFYITIPVIVPSKTRRSFTIAWALDTNRRRWWETSWASR